MLTGSTAVPMFVAVVIGLSGIRAAPADQTGQQHPPAADHGEGQLIEASALDSSGGGIGGDRQSGELNSELRCLALNIYFEARSEGEKGQLAVGHVVMNRVAHRGYPGSVCEVVKQGGEAKRHRCQFSWWCDGRSDQPAHRKAWRRALRLASEIFLGRSQDPTNGALWYHAAYVDPYWSKKLLQGDRIGQHIFYLQNKQSNSFL